MNIIEYPQDSGQIIKDNQPLWYDLPLNERKINQEEKYLAKTLTNYLIQEYGKELKSNSNPWLRQNAVKKLMDLSPKQSHRIFHNCLSTESDQMVKSTIIIALQKLKSIR